MFTYTYTHIYLHLLIHTHMSIDMYMFCMQAHENGCNQERICAAVMELLSRVDELLKPGRSSIRRLSCKVPQLRVQPIMKPSSTRLLSKRRSASFDSSPAPGNCLEAPIASND